MHILPQLRELEREFPNELVVIGVHSAKFPEEKRSENLRKAVLRYELEHPVVNDGDFAIWQEYAVRAWPTLMIVDPLGYVVGKHEGEFDLAAMRDFIQRAVAAFDDENLIDRTPIPLNPEREETGTLRFPGKILVDLAEDRLFIADSGHHRVLIADTAGNVRRIVGDGAEGLVDGSLTTARFTHPQGL